MNKANIFGYVTQIFPSYKAEGFIILKNINELSGNTGLAIAFALKKTNFTSSFLPVVIKYPK